MQRSIYTQAYLCAWKYTLETNQVLVVKWPLGHPHFYFLEPDENDIARYLAGSLVKCRLGPSPTLVLQARPFPFQCTALIAFSATYILKVIAIVELSFLLLEGWILKLIFSLCHIWWLSLPGRSSPFLLVVWWNLSFCSYPLQGTLTWCHTDWLAMDVKEALRIVWTPNPLD